MEYKKVRWIFSKRTARYENVGDWDIEVITESIFSKRIQEENIYETQL